MDFIIKQQQQNHETLASEGTLEKIHPNLRTRNVFLFHFSALAKNNHNQKKRKKTTKKLLLISYEDIITPL